MKSEVLGNGDLLLRLRLPDRGVSPNARRGQSRVAALRKSRLVKEHRTYAKWMALQILGEVGAFETEGYGLAFFWRTAAFRDDDNADASCKAYRDGIAEALRMDDRKLRKVALSTHAQDKDCPRVEIRLVKKS